jgi:hypothetical protein
MDRRELIKATLGGRSSELLGGHSINLDAVSFANHTGQSTLPVLLDFPGSVVRTVQIHLPGAGACYSTARHDLTGRQGQHRRASRPGGTFQHSQHPHVMGGKWHVNRARSFGPVAGWRFGGGVSMDGPRWLQYFVRKLPTQIV